MAIIRTNQIGDLAVQSGRLQEVVGADYVRQKLASRFRFFLGEWFADKREGIPYFRDVLRKGADPDVIRSVFRSVLRNTPGVVSVKKFDVQLDTRQRRLSFEFEALAADGTIIRVTRTDSPFLVEI